eukprot:1656966-Pyramimonas_sp.AAC.1
MFIGGIAGGALLITLLFVHKEAIHAWCQRFACCQVCVSERRAPPPGRRRWPGGSRRIFPLPVTRLVHVDRNFPLPLTRLVRRTLVIRTRAIAAAPEGDDRMRVRGRKR